MEARKFSVTILVLGIIAASFVIAEMKNGLSVENADAAPLGGNTWYVGGSGPNNYTKIQDAIDNASDGDTVFVHSGIYYESVIVDKAINLTGENRDFTVIKGKGTTLLIRSDNVCINDFNITTNYSGCIPISNTGVSLYSNDTIKNCNVFLNNFQGIYLSASSADNIVSNCNIFNNNYGIRVENTNNIISYNNIYNNIYGIYNQGYEGRNIKACYNYWGSSYGPYHPTSNLNGTGDILSDNVNFIPWLTVPVKGGTEEEILTGKNEVDAIFLMRNHLLRNPMW